jgi:hypothetical protein
VLVESVSRKKTALRSVKPATARNLDLQADESLHLSSAEVNTVHPAGAVLAVCFLLLTLTVEALRDPKRLRDCTTSELYRPSDRRL